MALFHDFPYTNFHELNLDWIIRQLRKLSDQIDDLEVPAMIDGNLYDYSHALLIGDGMADGVGGVAGMGWAYYLTENMHLTSATIHQNQGGFATAGNSSSTYPDKNFADALEARAADMSLTRRTAVRLIVVMGGHADDNAATDQIRSGVEQFINSARLFFPNAAVYVFPQYTISHGLAIGSLQRLSLIGDSAAHTGAATCPDAFKWLLARPASFTGDPASAPSDYGHRMLARYVQAFINGWDGELVEGIYRVTWDNDVTGVIDGIYDNGMVYLHLRATISGYSSGNHDVCTLNQDLSVPGRSVYCSCRVGASGQTTGQAMIRVTSGGLVEFVPAGYEVSGSTDLEIDALLQYPIYMI